MTSENSDTMDRLYELKDTLGFATCWSYDSYDEPMRDFSQKHPFTNARWVDAGCNHKDNCYSVRLGGGKPCKRTPLTGDTWLDIWKSIDRYCAQKQCGHMFIERLVVEGDVLKVFCGS